MELKSHQLEAIPKIKNGSILCGGVGSGKTIASLAYYYKENGGSIEPKFIPPKKAKDLYIITTARKRDKLEWEYDMRYFLMSTKKDFNVLKNNIVVDSWNNIHKYKDIKDAFFIFDEQRLVGSGVWVKSFLTISRHNNWILLSATPGDTWTDYAPVFIANGFYKNITQFRKEHIIYAKYTSFPKIEGFMNTRRLVRLRESILVPMEFERSTVCHDIDVIVSYDKHMYKTLHTDRWNLWNDEPIKNASELCYSLRKIVNSDSSRIERLKEIVNQREKVIVFYNYDYELEALKTADYGEDVEITEWNGHKHQDIPDSKKWVYLVQYTAGAEGWNCIKTDTIVFYSQNYSYKILEQSRGRINRLNTPYVDLYYYHFKSSSNIDLAIAKAIRNKKKFNEGKYAGGIEFAMAA